MLITDMSDDVVTPAPRGPSPAPVRRAGTRGAGARRAAGVVGAAVLAASLTLAAAPPSQAAQGAGPWWPSEAPAAQPVTCPPATVEVSTAQGLKNALRSPAPGTVIAIAPGTYRGTFTATGRATARQPVFVCGGADAVLQGSGPASGTVLQLDGVQHWRLVGFTVRSGKKGIMADGVSSSVLQRLTVTDIGDEAVHLRSASTRNLVLGNTISGTGKREAKFGEGVYVGSAVSNWCTISACEPDRSDFNVVARNTITGTTAESVDVKEGTSSGVVAGNVFDGSALSGADSWVDVKGNGWFVRGNTGTSSPGAGFQTHDVVDGWGVHNVFAANTADVGGPGYGFELRPVADNRVLCNNVVRNAGQGLSNTACG